MLGFYENFPEKVHTTARFNFSISKKKLQEALIRVLYELNSETFCLEDIARPSIRQCTVIFEFGIAEANDFNYLDNAEIKRVLRVTRKTPFRTMDFFCALRYYKVQNGKKNPLRFDYYMFRFTFNKSSMENQVFHERGPRHVSPEDIAPLIVKKVNEKFSRKILKAFTAA